MVNFYFCSQKLKIEFRIQFSILQSRINELMLENSIFNTSMLLKNCLAETYMHPEDFDVRNDYLVSPSTELQVRVKKRGQNGLYLTVAPFIILMSM